MMINVKWLLLNLMMHLLVRMYNIFINKLFTESVMVKISKKLVYFFLVIFVLIFVTSIFLYIHAVKFQKVQNDKKILEEITRLSFLAAEKNLTVQDISDLIFLTRKDKHILSYSDTLDWLIRNNESEHAGHGMAFLSQYIQTGRVEFCIPHEIEHLGLFLEHNDFARVRNQVVLSKENLKSWEEKSDRSKNEYPTYYLNYEQVKSKINLIILDVENANYSNNGFKDKLKYVRENGVC